jgi:hypothetical protein
MSSNLKKPSAFVNKNANPRTSAPPGVPKNKVLYGKKPKVPSAPSAPTPPTSAPLPPSPLTSLAAVPSPAGFTPPSDSFDPATIVAADSGEDVYRKGGMVRKRGWGKARGG